MVVTSDSSPPTLSPSAISIIFSPVAGLIVGKVLPDRESTYSLLMKIYMRKSFFLYKSDSKFRNSTSLYNILH